MDLIARIAHILQADILNAKLRHHALEGVIKSLGIPCIH
jgi:hypothetical protein